MRVLTLSLVLSMLVVAGACDRASQDGDLQAGEVIQSDLTATGSFDSLATTPAPEPAPIAPAPKPVRSAPAPAPRASAPRVSSYRAPQHVPEVHRHTKRDAAIGAGVGAVVGGLTHGGKGAVIGGVLGGAAGAVIGHEVDKEVR